MPRGGRARGDHIRKGTATEVGNGSGNRPRIVTTIRRSGLSDQGNNMTIVLLGASGYVGEAFRRALRPQDEPFEALSRRQWG